MFMIVHVALLAQLGPVAIDNLLIFVPKKGLYAWACTYSLY